MDAEFEQRWRNIQPPFNGVTIASSDYIPMPLFQKVVYALVETLYAHRPDASLFQLMDWHEHDGVVLEARPSSWQELRSLVASVAALVARFHRSDTYVREAFFPAERDYYLRLYVPDAGDNPYHERDDPGLFHYGLFDVTCQPALATVIKTATEGAGLSSVTVSSASAFFDARYSG